MAGAQGDSTKYSFYIPGNANIGSGYTVTGLAQKYDGIYNYGGFALLGESLFDTCQSWGKSFIFGPYASTQEMNMYVSGHPEYDYDYRLTLSANWYVALEEHYIDSIGQERESLYVHLADTAITITQDVDGQRIVDRMDTLIHRKTRFTYQYWNNSSGDTGMYPMGYTWLANGINTYTQQAAAYAYVRRFILDTADYGDGAHRPTCFFADNQYIYGTAGTGPRLPDYYVVNSTAGGPTSQMDWDEVASIQSNTDSLWRYATKSTLPIDSAIANALDSACAANGLPKIQKFANTEKGNIYYNPYVLQYFSIFWELSFEYVGDAFTDWMAKDSIAHLIRLDPDRHLITEWRLDACWNPATWGTKDRLCYGAMAWFLTFQDTTIHASPVRWNDPTRWHECFQIDIGDPVDDTTLKTDTTGSGASREVVIKRRYYDAVSGDSGIAVFRTGYDTIGTNSDTVWVHLWDDNTTDTSWYYQIDENRDTSSNRVDSIPLFPIQGWIGTQHAPVETAPTIGTILPTSSYVDSTDAITSTITDDYGVNRAICYIRPPAYTPTDTIMDSSIATGDTAVSWDFSIDHLWTDSGDCYIVFVAIDDSGHTSRDSISLLIDIQQYSPVISEISPTSAYRDSTDNVSAAITDDYFINEIWNYVWPPDSTPGVNDSISIWDTTLASEPLWNPSHPYTWLDSGNYWIVFGAVDNDDDTTVDSIQILVSVQSIALETKTFDVSTGMIDAHGFYSNPTTNYETSIYLYASQLYYHPFIVDYSMDDTLIDSWTIDSIWLIWRSELQGNYTGNDTTFLYLSAVTDNRDWTEAGLTWNAYKSGSNWTTAGGDTAGCISDTTVLSVGTHPAGTWDTITIHANTTYGSDFLDSVKYSTGNFGFMLVNKAISTSGAAGNEIIYINSTEDAAAKRPYMIAFPSGIAASPTPDAGTVYQGIDLQGVDLQ